MSRAFPGKRAGRGFVAAALVTLAAPAVAYMIVRDTATTLVAGRDAAPPLDALARASQLAPEQLPPGSLDLALKLAPSAPLAFEPFVIAAHYTQQGDHKRRLALLEEARRRKSDHRPTRAKLMLEYARAGKLDLMISELNFLFESSEEIRAGAIPEIVKLMQRSDGQEALAKALASQPAWSKDFFSVAKQTPAVTPEQALELMELLRAVRSPAIRTQARELYFHSLMNAGRIREARTQWLATLPASQRRASDVLHNASFDPRRSDTTFGWKLRSDAQGLSEMSNQGLLAEHYGGAAAVLAQQVIALRPGRYRLAFSARAELQNEVEPFVWSLVCYAPERKLVGIPVANSGSDFTQQRATFTVPADCDGQKLLLTAEPGDISADATMETRQISITPA